MADQHPALAYAEVQLGVHQVYADAEAALAQMEDVGHRLKKAVNQRSLCDDLIRDREMELSIKETVANSELSQAALDRRLKRVFHEDQTLKELRHKRAVEAMEASGLDQELDRVKYTLKVRASRMEELGGYLNYLASVKNSEANTTKKPE